MNYAVVGPRIEGALRHADNPRTLLCAALADRARTEAERDVIRAVESALHHNKAHTCEPYWMRHAAERLRDAAEALAAELEAGADHAEEWG